MVLADTTQELFGPHPSIEFGACRIAEEAGELVQALTSVSRHRKGWTYEQRKVAVKAEAMDTVAMVLRALREL